jgi:hypothetical protein
MPRSATPQSVLAILKRQATKALSSLQQEIARQERELAALKAEAMRWMRALGASRGGTRATAAPLRELRRKRARLDWNAVLAELTPTFTAKDVAQKTGKPMEQVYAGVSRWIKGKKVRKTKDGYQKIGGKNARGREKEEVAKEPPAVKKKSLVVTGA